MFTQAAKILSLGTKLPEQVFLGGKAPILTIVPLMNQQYSEPTD